MTKKQALAEGDRALDGWLASWCDRNPDATPGVLLLDLAARDRVRVRRAWWRVFGTPIHGWVTGP